VLANGGSRVYKTVYSRLIGASNKSAAVLAASLTGRRFAIPPFQIDYELDPKDGEVWTGDAVRIESDLVLNSTTLLPDLRVYQIISANENTTDQRFIYSALEHSYGPAVSGDEDIEDPNVRNVYISGQNDQLINPIFPGVPRTLREYYEDSFGSTVLAAYDVRFIVDVGAVAGSSNNAEFAIKTGAWPELSTPPMIVNYNLIVGKGGNGANVGSSPEAGGPAILLENDIRLNNLSTIGGGGGGGGADSGSDVDAAGGGGGGFTNGIAGTGTSTTSPTGFLVQAENGTNTEGGRGAFADANDSATGGAGGDLGVSGVNSGGAAGVAIDLNGFTITYITTGTISGAIIT
jgi:hypothetical protein